MARHLFFILFALTFWVSHSSEIYAAELHAAKPLPENIQRIVDTNTYPRFVRECFAGAVEKLKQRAKAKEAVLKKETIAVDEIDARWYNPSKYVWFSAKIETPEGLEKITVLMQKPLKGACF
jgi:hypothetical protein